MDGLKDNLTVVQAILQAQFSRDISLGEIH